MTAIHSLSSWPALRWPWFLVAAVSLTLELIALYFQYGMGLEPCIMCVYQRTAIAGIFLASLPALLSPTNLIARTVSSLGLLVSAGWGLKIAIEHVRMQNPDNFMLLMSCDVFPNYPNWMPLHQWLPAIFEPRGMCGDIDWVFLTLSMPQWMVVVFGGFTVATLVVVLSRLFKLKQL